MNISLTTLVLLTTAAGFASAAPKVVTIPTPGAGIQPVAQADAEGIVHLVYYLGDPAHGDLFYSKRPPGSDTFEPPIQVNSTAGSAIAIGTIRGAQMALGREGHIHVAWNGSHKVTPEGDHHRAPMLYARSTDGGKTFEAERNLITKAYGLDGGGAIAADATGRVEVFWHAGGHGEGAAGRKIWVTRSADDGKIFAPETLAWDEPTGVCGCCGMTAGAAAGRSWAVYRAAGEGVHRDIYLLRSDPKSDGFTGEKLDLWDTEKCPMSAMSLDFAGDATAVAWEAKSGDLAYRIAGTDLGGRVPHARRPLKYPDVALSPDGHTLLAWADGAGWNRGGKLGWQLFDPNAKPSGDPGAGKDVAIWSKPAAVYAGDTFLIIY